MERVPQAAPSASDGRATRLDAINASTAASICPARHSRDALAGWCAAIVAMDALRAAGTTRLCIAACNAASTGSAAARVTAAIRITSPLNSAQSPPPLPGRQPHKGLRPWARPQLDSESACAAHSSAVPLDAPRLVIQCVTDRRHILPCSAPPPCRIGCGVILTSASTVGCCFFFDAWPRAYGYSQSSSRLIHTVRGQTHTHSSHRLVLETMVLEPPRQWGVG